MKKIIFQIIGFILLIPFYLKKALAIDIDNFNDQVIRPDNLPVGVAAQNAPVEAKINFVINFLINLILFASGGVAVFFLVLAGIQYITSIGNQERMDAAKKTMQHALIGLVVVIFSYAVITNIIDLIFRATI